MTRSPIRPLLLALPLALALLAAAPAAAAIPQVLTYSGYLKTGAGAPVTSATDLTFRLYGAQAAATPLWAEQVSVVPSSDGWFSAVLGTATALPAGISGDALWLALQVGADAEFPQRLRVTPSPAALAVDWSGVQGKPACGAGQFLTLDGGGDLVCTAPASGGLTSVQVGAGLTGQGTAGSPLGLVLGAGGAQAALNFGGSSACPAGTVVNGADAGTGLVSCTALPGVDPSRLLPGACASGQVAKYQAGAGWVCADESAGVVVDGTLTGDGLLASPISVRLGPGLFAGPAGVSVDAGPGLLLLPGGSQLAVDLPTGSAGAGFSTQVARADHRHRGSPAIQLKPSDFVEQPGAATPVLGRISLDANTFPWRVVPAMTLPPQAIAYAVAQFPAGMVEGTTATIHLSVAGETPGASVRMAVNTAAYGVPGTSLGGNLSYGGVDFRVLPAKGTDVVTFTGIQIYPRTVPPLYQEPPLPGDLFVIILMNNSVGAGAAPFHLVGAQITFDTP